MPAELDTIRPVIDEENTRKLREWERTLWDRYHVQVPPNRLINIILQSVEFLEIEQTIKLGIKDTETKPGAAKRPKPRLIIKSTLGKAGF